ncbi:MAG: PorV/PorQ family protein [Flavobacteriales bacterium]|nr:PorV/PorQ family protein [Flavobacteriales bacterium]
MNHFKLTLGVVLILLCSLGSQAQLTRKYSNEFLAIGVSARALGMSNSVVSTTNDVTGGYWNPAGILGIQSDLQVAAMHAEYFAGIAKYDYAALGKQIDTTSAVALSVIRFGVDDIPNTTELIDAEGNINYDRITTFSAADYAFILSYARKMKKGLNVGVNAKVVYRHVGDFASAFGFGIDAAATYRWKEWNFGVMARDITTTFNAWSTNLDDRTKEVFELTGNEIPQNSVELTLPRIILGASRTFSIKKFSILPELNIDLTTDGKRNTLVSANPISLDPHFGLELGYNTKFFVRGGIGNVQKESDIDGNTRYTFQPNFGVGLQFERISLDYALSDIGDQSVALYSNVFSLRFDIVKKPRN